MLGLATLLLNMKRADFYRQTWASVSIGFVSLLTADFVPKHAEIRMCYVASSSG